MQFTVAIGRLKEQRSDLLHPFSQRYANCTPSQHTAKCAVITPLNLVKSRPKEATELNLCSGTVINEVTSR